MEVNMGSRLASSYIAKMSRFNSRYRRRYRNIDREDVLRMLNELLSGLNVPTAIRWNNRRFEAYQVDRGPHAEPQQQQQQQQQPPAPQQPPPAPQQQPPAPQQQPPAPQPSPLSLHPPTTTTEAPPPPPPDSPLFDPPQQQPPAPQPSPLNNPPTSPLSSHPPTMTTVAPPPPPPDSPISFDPPQQQPPPPQPSPLNNPPTSPLSLHPPTTTTEAPPPPPPGSPISFDPVFDFSEIESPLSSHPPPTTQTTATSPPTIGGSGTTATPQPNIATDRNEGTSVEGHGNVTLTEEERLAQIELDESNAALKEVRDQIAAKQSEIRRARTCFEESVLTAAVVNTILTKLPTERHPLHGVKLKKAMGRTARHLIGGPINLPENIDDHLEASEEDLNCPVIVTNQPHTVYLNPAATRPVLVNYLRELDELRDVERTSAIRKRRAMMAAKTPPGAAAVEEDDEGEVEEDDEREAE